MAEEKLSVYAEEVADSEATPTPTSLALAWDPTEERKLVRLIDLRIFPIMIILFVLNFIDRVNFANARLKGLEEDLGLSDVEYQTCISILLVGYISFQVPSNMILNKVTRPSWYICGLVILWGAVSAATGAIQNARGAIAARFFLGCVEAGFFGGCILFCSRWYRRDEIALRVALLSCGNTAAQMFGGLIAAGILGGMEGTAGLRAWRWLFIVEGAVTVACGIFAIFLLPDYPTTTRFLSERQRMIAHARLGIDVGISDDDDKGNAVHGLKLAVTDIKVWLLGFCYFCHLMAQSYSYFFPTITKSLGYSSIITLLLTAPPWAFTTVVAIAICWHADRYSGRFWQYIVPMVLEVVGCIIAMTTRSTGPRYFSMFLMPLGFCGSLVILSWVPTTVSRPPAKRAAAIGIVNAMGNLGSIPGSYLWPISWGPYYGKSFGATIALAGAAVLFALALRLYLPYLNKKLDREDQLAFEATQTAVQRTAEVEGVSQAGAIEQAKKTFRYIY